MPEIANGGHERPSLPRTAEQTARGFRNGDPRDVGAVKDRVSRILRYGALRIPDTDRKDLEQEIMTQLWRAATGPSFDTQAGFWGFVEVVTARRCIDWLRSQRASEPLDESLIDGREGPLDQALHEERLRLASAVLKRLSGRCQELIQLRVREKKSYREISKMLGKSQQALRVRLFRCIQAARLKLDELETGQLRGKGNVHRP